MSQDHKTVRNDEHNFTVTFHPAFASRCAVTSGDGECVVYEQGASERHHFPTGMKHPKKHTIRLEGGKHNRDITFDISDPNHAIKSITVELYGDEGDPYELEASTARKAAEPTETFTVMNNANTCPPNCPT